MKIYLNLPGGPYGVELISQIKEFGWDGIRHDAPVSPEALVASVDELAAAGLEAIWLVAGGTMLDQLGAPLSPELIRWHAGLIADAVAGRAGNAIEIGNEPDIAHPFWRERPEQLAKLVSRIAGEDAPDVSILSPSVSNLNRRGCDYLERMLPFLGGHVTVAVHRYPASHRWESSHIGRARADEIAELRRIIGARAFTVTETGWSEGPHDTCFGLRRINLTEAEVGARLVRELEWWTANEAEAVVVYQINDGPDRTDPLHRFGVRRVGGSWKSWADLPLRRYYSRTIMKGQLS